jgi:hypothetical protein
MEPLESGAIGHIFNLLTKIVNFIQNFEKKNYVDFLKNPSSILKNISSNATIKLAPSLISHLYHKQYN